MRLTIFLALLACLQPFVAAAQDPGSFPSVPITSKTLQVQQQAEEVFERTDYKRAFFIYRNELAPIGDKYGQYMVGYMYLTGKGVEEDIVAASAWYRLAAERGITRTAQDAWALQSHDLARWARPRLARELFTIGLTNVRLMHHLFI